MGKIRDSACPRTSGRPPERPAVPRGGIQHIPCPVPRHIIGVNRSGPISPVVSRRKQCRNGEFPGIRGVVADPRYRDNYRRRHRRAVVARVVAVPSPPRIQRHDVRRSRLRPCPRRRRVAHAGRIRVARPVDRLRRRTPHTRLRHVGMALVCRVLHRGSVVDGREGCALPKVASEIRRSGVRPEGVHIRGIRARIP